jgi:large subunit ribosomal protein L10
MPNPKVLAEKQQLVAEVADKLRNSASTVFTDYRGLTVSEVTELRKQLREAGIEFKVIKNTLTRRAAQETEFTELNPYLTGPTAIAFGSDAVAPAKIIVEFAKTNENLKVKAGIVEGRVVDADQIKALAALPSREGLLSMLLSVLQAPMRNFALAVKAVGDQKEQQA